MPLYEVYSSTGAFVLGQGVRSLTRYFEGVAAFNGEEGYDEADIEAIVVLPLGGTWASGDYGSWHRIRSIAGPATVAEPLMLDAVAEDNGDFEGTDALYAECRTEGGLREDRIVDAQYFRESGGYSHEALNVAGNLGVNETWTADGIVLRRIR